VENIKSLNIVLDIMIQMNMNQNKKIFKDTINIYFNKFILH